MAETSAPLNLQQLARLWPVARPWHARPTAASIANTNYFIDTPDGTYVLRLYGEPHIGAVEHEHAVLGALQTQALPFGIPVPIRTTAGLTYATVEYADQPALASLTPLLPGGRPDGAHSISG